VWIEHLDIHGFRGLSGEFTFSPTLTLVIGDNEAGKSTLHEALMRTLFGFSRIERRRSRGTSLLERRAPWDGGTYGLVARLRDGDRTFRVDWDFANHRVQVVDGLGTDLSDELASGRDEVELGEHFLGIGIDDFRQVCCIDQDALSAVRSSPTLGVALQEAVAKAGGGVPVEHAVDRLNEYLRSIGARTDTLRPSPAGRLSALERDRTQLKQQLREAEETRDEIERLARDATTAQEQLRKLEAEREWMRQRLLADESRELEQRLAEARRLDQQSRDRPERISPLAPEAVEEARIAQGRAEELEGELTSARHVAAKGGDRIEELEADQRALRNAVDGLEPYADVHASARDKVRTTWAQLEGLASDAKELDNRLTEATGSNAPGQERSEVLSALEPAMLEEVRVAQARVGELAEERLSAERAAAAPAAQIEGLESRQRVLQAGVDGLEPYAEVDASARDEVRESWAQLEAFATRTTLTEAERFEPDPDLAAYRADRAELLALAVGEQERPQRRRWLWIALVILSLGVAWSLRRIVRRRREGRAGATLAERLERYGSASLEELDARVAEEDRGRLRSEAVAEALRRAQVEADERRRSLAEQLEAALDQVGAPTAAGLEQRVRAYLTAVERHEELREQQAKLAHVERELEQARQPVREQRRLAQEHERAVRRLREAYSVAGIDEPDLDQAAEALERLVTQTEHARRREQEAKAAADALRSLLADETLELLEARTANARRQVDEHVEVFGVLAASHEGTPDQMRAALATVDKNVREKVGEARALEARVAQREEQASDPAPLKERIAAVEASLDRLSEAKDAVALARDVLEEAADELRREFAPHLNEALERNLARVTNGRYAKAFVDGELNVQVEIRDSGQLKPADELSRATKDQLFLIERLEIARLLGPTKGPAPLLLDDPFAHYDRTRLRRGLEVIADAAQERQVILFSEDHDLIDPARELCATCAVIELPTPVSPGDRQASGSSAS